MCRHFFALQIIELDFFSVLFCFFVVDKNGNGVRKINSLEYWVGKWMEFLQHETFVVFFVLFPDKRPLVETG